MQTNLFCFGIQAQNLLNFFILATESSQNITVPIGICKVSPTKSYTLSEKSHVFMVGDRGDNFQKQNHLNAKELNLLMT